jgi:hypothetical protein
MSQTVPRTHLPGIKAGLAMSLAVAPGLSSATLITLCNLLVLTICCIIRDWHTAFCTLLRIEKSVGRFAASMMAQEMDENKVFREKGAAADIHWSQTTKSIVPLITRCSVADRDHHRPTQG